ncbi:MAG: ketoacyl-ACP synthase III [Planctomycetota bacterium]
MVLDNRALIDRFGLDVDEAWIESRTGIRERHWMAPDQTTSDMAAEAGRAVLESAGVEPDALDRIVLATISPDRVSPATAVEVAAKLGARCPAYDVSAACAGFVYALDAARGAIACGEERVLVLAADARSRFVDTRDRRGAVLFADGAAGALVVPGDGPGRIVSVQLGAEGGGGLGAWIPAGGAARPATHETVEAGEHFVHVDAFRPVFERFKRLTREGVAGALRRAGVALGDVDVFITHQGNAFLVDEIVADLGVDPT